MPAVKLYARQFAKRTGIKVRLDAARMRAKLPAGYETALYKVLQGALSNVVAHADAHRVKITLTSGQDSVTMKIEDDGRGFNVGRKLRAPRQSFGLRAMRERVELLGGAIHFASRPARRRADCRGTTIELHLPLHDIEISMKERIRVLLCDDHTLFREGIKAILKDELSIEIVGEAEDGRQAVAQALQLHPDVVLMDIAMPDLSGFEATRRILQSEPQDQGPHPHHVRRRRGDQSMSRCRRLRLRSQGCSAGASDSCH